MPRVSVLRSIVLAAIAVFISAEPAYSQEWIKRFIIDGKSASLSSIREIPGGGFVVGGSASQDDVFYYAVVRLDSWGNPVWAKLASAGAGFAKVAVASDGSFYVGLSENLDYALRVVHLSPAGDVLWEHRVAAWVPDGWDIVILPDDSVVVAVGGNATTEVLALRLDPFGQKLWDVSISIPECEFAGCKMWFGDLVPLPNSGVQLASALVSKFGLGAFVLIQLDHAGVYQTHAAFDTNAVFTKFHARQTFDGGFMVVGTHPQQPIVLARLSESLELSWAKHLNTPGVEGSYQDMELGGDDSVYIVSNYDDPPFVDPEIRKFGSDGTPLWGRGFTCSTSSITSQFFGVDTMVDGRVAAVGRCGFWSVIAVLGNNGLVDGPCPMDSVTTFATDAVITPLPLTVNVTSFDHSLSFSPTQFMDQSVTLVEECTGPPSEVSPPGAEQSLVFTDSVTLLWDEASKSGSEIFNLYRGKTGNSTSQYGSCHAPGLEVNSVTEFDVPPSGVGRTYLVSGTNIAGEGPLGFDSSGAPRSTDLPCLH